MSVSNRQFMVPATARTRKKKHGKKMERGHKKKPKMKAFAPAWYQYFPEQMPRSAMMAHAQQSMKHPMPKR